MRYVSRTISSFVLHDLRKFIIYLRSLKVKDLQKLTISFNLRRSLNRAIREFNLQIVRSKNLICESCEYLMQEMYGTIQDFTIQVYSSQTILKSKGSQFLDKNLRSWDMYDHQIERSKMISFNLKRVLFRCLNLAWRILYEQMWEILNHIKLFYN